MFKQIKEFGKSSSSKKNLSYSGPRSLAFFLSNFAGSPGNPVLPLLPRKGKLKSLRPALEAGEKLAGSSRPGSPPPYPPFPPWPGLTPQLTSVSAACVLPTQPTGPHEQDTHKPWFIPRGAVIYCEGVPSAPCGAPMT